MNIRPLYDRIVVKRIEAGDEKTSGGLIIPDTAKEKPQEGEVVAIGKGKRLEDGKVISLDVQVGDRVQVVGGLLLAEAAIQIGPQAAMPGVADELADVIGVIDDVFERNGFGNGDADLPAGFEHPVVERGADHRAPRDERLEEEPPDLLGQGWVGWRAGRAGPG